MLKTPLPSKGGKFHRCELWAIIRYQHLRHPIPGKHGLQSTCSIRSSCCNDRSQPVVCVPAGHRDLHPPWIRVVLQTHAVGWALWCDGRYTHHILRYILSTQLTYGAST